MIPPCAPYRSQFRLSTMLTAAALLLQFAGCRPTPDPAPETLPDSIRTYEGRGVVRSVSADGRAITVSHEAIADLMPAMTMPFEVRDPTEASGLVSGDGIAFRLSMTPRTAFIDQVRKIDPALLSTAAATELAPPVARVARYRIGDLVPDASLIDQDGHPLRLSKLRGRPVLMTFIYTRCPVPTFCPLLSANFKALQARFRERGMKVHLLSVTLDPEYDTPSVLKRYAGSQTGSTETWTFATGEPSTISELAARAGLFNERLADGTLNHTLATLLIGPDGRLVELWRGNGWRIEEVAARVDTLARTGAVSGAASATPAGG